MGYGVRMATYDVAIVGLGAVGSAAAWQLARRGVRVVGFDRFSPPHHFGSSHGYGRIIREAYAEGTIYVPLVQRAYALWDDLAATTLATLRLETGGLTFGGPGSTLVAGAVASAERFGLAIERLDAKGIERRAPALTVPADTTGVWEPRAGVLFPERGIRSMLLAAERAGARFFFDSRVTGWRRNGRGIVVATPAQDVTVDRVVLAAGPWLAEVAAPAALPLTVERAVQCWFAPPPGSDLFAP
jgi:sarcosine oxidase